jgi:3-phenylpropionate/cinnamic acid dioxygenase small subunit
VALEPETDVSVEIERACERFLFHEAELLDDNRVHDWFELIAEDIDYRLPVRITRERAAGHGFSDTAWHMRENHASLHTRVRRLDSEYAWAEDPPSRTRRLVTNVRVRAGAGDDEYAVRSNLLVYRSRYDADAHQIIAGERHDVLRGVGGRLKLARRDILLDQATLATHNLAIFL